MKELQIKLNNASYSIYIGYNLLQDIDNFFNISNSSSKKYLIVSDDNIPTTFTDIIKSKIKNSFSVVIPHGEQNKNFENYKKILSSLIDNEFTRKDAMIALGGGMIGDMTAFAASTYMRGIEFYNIPTTLLSQVDSSVGGKTAIDFMNVKNVVGSFYQPRAVLIDINTLKTLTQRELKNGLVESIKMATTFDEEFFKKLKEMDNIEDNLEYIIFRSLELKKAIVEKDEKEQNIRKSLNFGHTIGHAIEETVMPNLLHGECVGIGMLYFSSDNVKNELKNILTKFNLPINYNFDKEKVFKLLKHDKKSTGDKISAIQVNEIGSYKIVDLPIDDIQNLL